VRSFTDRIRDIKMVDCRPGIAQGIRRRSRIVGRNTVDVSRPCGIPSVLQRDKTKASLFAALDGNVVKLYVKSGDEVQKDQPLLEMRSTELGVQFEELNGKIAANLANIRRLEKDIVDDRLSPFEQTRNGRELDANRALQEGYQKELQLLEV
jgi:multidrug efflux pump subunit AcrA (membrane-fusion protein)